MKKLTWYSCLLVALAACSSTSAGGKRSAQDVLIRQDVERIRAGTQLFQSLDRAVEAGYARTVTDCLVHEQHGAMGFHHVNSSYVDAKLELERPEILLYERKPDGSYRLNAVEFVIPYRAWPRDSVAPVLMGQRLKHEDNLKIWYLHVWAWSNNADGLFADFSPGVVCPDENRKVFRPFPG
jgi:hypothetical protein